MNAKELLEFIRQLIEQYRVEVGDRPDVMPVTWQGLNMTIEEAKLVIQGLEDAKPKYQKAMNSTQAGGDITKLAAGGAGIAAMATGVVLTLFPPTTIAGLATIAAGAGTCGNGQAVGDGVKTIGTSSNNQAIEQIDAYIASIKNAIITSI